MKSAVRPVTAAVWAEKAGWDDQPQSTKMSTSSSRAPTLVRSTLMRTLIETPRSSAMVTLSAIRANEPEPSAWMRRRSWAAGAPSRVICRLDSLPGPRIAAYSWSSVPLLTALKIGWPLCPGPLVERQHQSLALGQERLSSEQEDGAGPVLLHAALALDLRHAGEDAVNHLVGHPAEQMRVGRIGAHVVLEAVRAAEIALVGRHDHPGRRALLRRRSSAASWPPGRRAPAPPRRSSRSR